MRKSQEDIAREIAMAAHAGQVDKGGNDYILHPQAVASNVGGDECRAVAWLHDVLEDTNVTEDDLLGAGLLEQVVEAVKVITKRQNEDYHEYLQRVKNNDLARAVKCEDLINNCDLSRLRREVEAEDIARVNKYVRSLQFLLS